MFSKKKTECRVCGYRLHIGAGKHLHGGRAAFYDGYADESADALFGG